VREDLARPLRLTARMRQVLRQIADGRGAEAHCRTQSDFGGLESVLRGLVRRGLILWEDRSLTAAGRELMGLPPSGAPDRLWGKPLSWFRPEGGAS